MQLFGPSSTRNFPVDRNPLVIAAGGQDLPAAGATDAVFTYVVPAGRRFQGSVSLRVLVTTALAAGQGAYAELQALAASRYRANVGAAAAVGAIGQTELADIAATAGQTLLGQAHLDAGAGVVICHVFLHGVEYDV